VACSCTSEHAWLLGRVRKRCGRHVLLHDAFSGNGCGVLLQPRHCCRGGGTMLNAQRAHVSYAPDALSARSSSSTAISGAGGLAGETNSG